MYDKPAADDFPGSRTLGFTMGDVTEPVRVQHLPRIAEPGAHEGKA